MTNLEKKMLLVLALLITTLAVFSYAYVDLNLTFSQNPFVLGTINKLQYFGYFKRDMATLFYMIILSLLFMFYIANLYLFNKGRLSRKYLIASLLTSTLILIPAYPFLSYDLFNYMFDARIITHYNLNPYTHKPLDFPSDDWIRFMRWVHRYSPYGPLWLAYTVIPSLMGFGKFISTFMLFKFFIGVFHIINSYIIYKTLSRANANTRLMATSFYALNPLFLIEGVANGHNDIVHSFFVLLSIYLALNIKAIKASAFVILGSLVKYLALLSLAPIVLFRMQIFKAPETLIALNIAIYAAFTWVFSSVRVTVPFISSGSLQTQFQPWYLFWTLPLVALFPGRKLLIYTSIALSFSAMLRYLPFLRYGEWSLPGTTEFMQVITVAIPFFVLLFLILKKIK